MHGPLMSSVKVVKNVQSSEGPGIVALAAFCKHLHRPYDFFISFSPIDDTTVAR